jgi:DNA repair exonuclease SbcCD nuclease subunit
MSTTFLHTADWQLGKPFAGVDDIQKRSLIQQERINVIQRLGQAAQIHGAEFIVVAGDLFDSSSTTKATVSAACAAIGAIQMPVFVIPGNHDHGGPGSLWEQAFFQHEHDQLAQNLTVLLKPEPVEFERAVLFPCPLLRRHESADPTAWLRSAQAELGRFGDKPRVVLAHGSVQGFGLQEDDEGGEGGAINQIDLSRLAADFDYIALGDWHGTKQVGAKAWYAGTPEPDRFPRGAGNEPGYVLIVSAQRGASSEVKRERVARLGWHQLFFEFSDDTGMTRLEEEIEALIGNRAQQDLLLLELCGSLGIEATTRLEQLLEAWQARLLRMKLFNQTVVAPSSEEIEALTQRTSDPLIARVAAKLVASAGGTGEDALCAGIALRELHAVCREI